LLNTAPVSPVCVDAKAGSLLVVASYNGNSYKNGGSQTVVEKAFELIANGSDVLDALVAAVNIVELDPEDTSVGYGGLPNADGVVQLDSCCMHGPTRRMGAVAALEGVRTPSVVAQRVLEETDQHVLVGKGAQDFARRMGFAIEPDLNTDRSRRLWREWKRSMQSAPASDRAPRDNSHSAGLEMIRRGWVDLNHYWGTISCNAISARGDIAAVTTTSGLAWKIPGRIGDSAIPGAGLYLDAHVGAVGSTGRGEANLYALSSFFIVEEMRRGAHPKDAAFAALRRVVADTVDASLLNSRGLPNFGLSFYAFNVKREYAGVSLYPSIYTVCTERGPATLNTEPLFEGQPTD
jgi:N4-(beta-N-acetylglucosaminyl)-L-asparaginase